MTFAQARAALRQWTLPAIKPGLSRTRSLLKKCHHPDCAYPIIQIAGTNGKGSVAAMVATVLTTAGYRVGRFTSPHLAHERERITIDQHHVSPQAFARAVARLLPALQSLARQNKWATAFEAWTVLAAIVFEQAGIDLAVVEVGMGGRFDATTALKQKILTLITNIDLDHTAVLGASKEAICFEKMGITKKKVPLLTSESDRKIRQAIKELAARKQVPVFFCGYQPSDAFRILTHQADLSGTSMTASNDDGQPCQYKTNLLGTHQVLNMGLAVMAAKWCAHLGLNVDEGSIQSGLRQVNWPGRMEIIHRKPLIIADGAHNPAAVRALLQTINPKEHQIKLIIGIMQDKAIAEIIDMLAPVSQAAWTCKPASQDRGLSATRLAKLFAARRRPATSCRSIKAAVRAALATACPKDLFLITGSLYHLEPAKRAVWQWFHANAH